MPNHVSNRLTIIGTTEQVAKVFDEIKGVYTTGEARPIDFNNIVPMPDVLKNVGKGRNTIDGRTVDSWWTDSSTAETDPNKKPDRLLTAQEIAEIAKTGFSDWYDWSIANWGTKWNAYDSKRLSENAIYFETAWSAPFPVIKALATKYEGVEFRLEYADEDIGRNAGLVRFISGSVTDDSFPITQLIGEKELEGVEAAKLWFSLNPESDPKDRGYDPKTFEYVGDEDEARMTASDFYKLVLALWGEDWRPDLYDLLRKHGHRYSRQTFYNWQKGLHPVPEPVAVILNKEAKRKEVTISEPAK